MAARYSEDERKILNERGYPVSVKERNTIAKVLRHQRLYLDTMLREVLEGVKAGDRKLKNVKVYGKPGRPKKEPKGNR